MILYQLKCADDHRFEIWFRDGATFDRQSNAGEIECPFCGDTRVTKAPMAPALAGRGEMTESPEDRARVVARQILRAVHENKGHVEENCEYVGTEFAEEARRIHYGEADERGIYGEASEEDAQDLNDEGIEVSRIPWPQRRDN